MTQVPPDTYPSLRPPPLAARIRKLVPITLVTVALSACAAVGPDYVLPETDAPSRFSSELERGLIDGPARLADWWKTLDDPVLDSLLARSMDANLDLREALARIEEARAVRGAASADYLPGIDASAAASRDQTSRETALGEFAPRVANLFSIGFDSSWEIDLWGRVRRSVEAADADIDVSIEDARDVLVTVLAETALNYVELRNGQERVRIARANIELQARTLELTENRFRAGLVSQLDVAQARTNLESSRATLPPLEAGQREARNRLAVILGVVPGTLDAELAAVRPIPAPSIDVAVGVPADLLRRRPDIRRAERALAAQTARIGLAEADLYPRFALFGSIGLEAEDASDLLRPGAATFGFGPSVSWNLFDRGRVRRNIAVQNARQEQALIQYEHAVLTALEEVENSMTRFVRDQDRRDSIERAAGEARRSVELSREQYRRGLVGFQSVLDTQRRLFELEDDLALATASIASDLIRLYKALGGGWESILAPLHTAEESRP